MKVHELITKLQSFPPDHYIVVNALECGVNDCFATEPVAIVRDCHCPAAWYDGEHEIVDDGIPNAVLIK